MKRKFIGMCPYCNKKIGLEVEVYHINIKESKVKQDKFEKKRGAKRGGK